MGVTDTNRRRLLHRVAVYGAALLFAVCTFLTSAGATEVGFDYCVYVVSSRDNAVSVVDPEAMREGLRIPVGSNPDAIAFSVDGLSGYVADGAFSPYGLSVIDVPSKSVRSRVPLESGNPTVVVAHPSGHLLYVGDSSRLHVVDIGSEAVIKTINTGSVEQIAFTPDGQQAIVTRGFRQNAAIIDAITHELVEELDIPQAGGIGITRNGAFALMPNAEFVGLTRIVNLFTRTVTAEVAVDSIPRKVATSSDGAKAYVAHSHIGVSTLSVIDLRTFLLEASITVEPGPFGLAVSPDDQRVYVGSSQSDQVVVVDAQTNAVVGAIPVAANPNEVALVAAPGGCILPTPTVTSTSTATRTPTATRTASPSRTGTPTATPTRTDSPTITPGGPTLTPTATPSATLTATVTETPHTMAGPAYVVRRFDPAYSSQDSSPYGLTAVGGNVFFVARTLATGYEVWQTDGTTTRITLDIAPGAEDSDPNDLTVAGDLLFFTASIGLNGDQLWRTDGTVEGTARVTNRRGLGGVSRVQALGDAVGFVVTAPAGTQLWRSAGDEASTVPLSDTLDYPTDGISLIQAGGVLYLALRYSPGLMLYSSDLTREGTVVVAEFPADEPFGRLATLMPTADRLYFSVRSGHLAAEPHQLWVTDGSVEGTLLLNDNLSWTGPFVDLGDRLLFSAALGDSGQELWISDGTPEGTSLFMNIYPGPEGSVTQGFGPALNGTVLLAARDPLHGRELWATQGTPETTFMLKEFNPGLGDSFISFWPATDDSIYFNVSIPGGPSSFWKSDGTAEGTTLLRETALSETPLSATFLGSVGGYQLFSGGDGEHGRELWRTDGTPEGTVLVKDIAPGGSSSSPREAVVSKDRLFMQATTDAGRELWMSDGTAEGTVPVANLAADVRSVEPTEMTSADNWLVFRVFENFSSALWRTNGSEVDTYPLDFSSLAYATWGDSLFAGSGNDLIEIDLATGDRRVVRTIPASGVGASIRSMTSLGDALYFAAAQTGHGSEPWRSDGSAEGTFELEDVASGGSSSQPRDFVQVGDQVFFLASGLNELWVTDGTGTGTRQVVPAAVVRPNSGSLASVEGRVVFTGYGPATGTELWSSDGTAEGTQAVDITPGTAGSNFLNLEVARGLVYLAADDGIVGYEPWRSDGTPLITHLLRDINPETTIRSGREQPAGSFPREFTELGSIVLFAAEDFVHGRELWRTNGTEAGTVLVKDIYPGPVSSSPSSLVRIGGYVYFSACGSDGCELWRTDGTAGGTEQFVDVLPGPLSSTPQELTNVGSLLFFSAYENTTSRQLWAVNVAMP